MKISEVVKFLSLAGWCDREADVRTFQMSLPDAHDLAELHTVDMNGVSRPRVPEAWERWKYS